MKFSLAKLIVWPRDGSKDPRVVSFTGTGINLITGSSRSGKSAIIKIIDYCLGSGTCNIPKPGPIRRSSACDGLVIRTAEGYKLFARRDPDAQESTEEYMLVESALPIVPERPVKNTNRDAIKGLLARLTQLPQATADFYETGKRLQRPCVIRRHDIVHVSAAAYRRERHGTLLRSGGRESCPQAPRDIPQSRCCRCRYIGGATQARRRSASLGEKSDDSLKRSAGP